MYAFVVKNDEGTWDVWNTLAVHPNPEKEARLQAVIATGLPVTGMILTPYNESAKIGATWNGEEFIGGLPKAFAENTDWTTVTQYGYVCDNTIVIMFYSQPGISYDEQLQAIFNSETIMISVENANIGDIWDGTQIVSV